MANPDLEDLSSKLSLEKVKSLGDSQTYSRASTLSKTFGDLKCVHSSKRVADLVFLETHYPPNTSTVVLNVHPNEKPTPKACHCSCDPGVRDLKGCKHVLALILHFIRSPRSFLPRETPPFELEAAYLLPKQGEKSTGGQAVEEKTAVVGGHDKPPVNSKKRTLPSWMTGGPVERKEFKKPEAEGPKYVMLEHELLAAAADFLRNSASPTQEENQSPLKRE